METSLINRLIILVLIWGVAVFTLKLVSDQLYANPSPAKQGYVLIENPAIAQAAPPAEKQEISPVPPQSDAAHGMRIFRQCALCHLTQAGGPNRTGPHLAGIIDRPVASIPAFGYSRAMRALGAEGAVWSEERLRDYLRAPSHMVPGTTMSFAGLAKPEDIADLIAYLRSLSASSSSSNHNGKTQ